MGYFESKNDASHNSGFALKFFFSILPSQKGQYVDENNINGLY